MKLPDDTRKPSLIAIFALTIIALLVFLATGALLAGNFSVSDPDDILSIELNTLKSQVKNFEQAPPQSETPESTPVRPESNSIQPLAGGSVYAALKWRP